MTGFENLFLSKLIFPGDKIPDSTAELSMDCNRGLQGQDIVALSTQDWRDLWTRKQRFMQQFARQGNKVLYVESQIHWLGYIKRFKRQWRRVYLFLLGPRQVEPNLYIYTPPLLLTAFQIFPILNVINNFILSRFLLANMRKLGIENPLLWLYSHYNSPLIKKLNCKRALYECVDEFSGAKGLINPEVAKDLENKTLDAVDAAIVTAPALKLSKTNHNSNIHIIPNAANVAHFGKALLNLPEPNEMKGLGHPRLIFIGAVAYWIDLQLLEHLATERPEWQIILVGPVLVNTKKLQTFSNVHILGKQSYHSLPAYLASSEVALNPYLLDSVAENCSPLKLYEYMAAALPVVSTNMPEARHFPGIINVAISYDNFIVQTEKILGWSPDEREQHRKRALKEAQKHTWEKRFLEAEKIAVEVLK
jgi:glycosyltransferase involved in cell wall biosynthesis